eukprot:7991109-Pyramimonas_sp.AAC.1
MAASERPSCLDITRGHGAPVWASEVREVLEDLQKVGDWPGDLSRDAYATTSKPKLTFVDDGIVHAWRKQLHLPWRLVAQP